MGPKSLVMSHKAARLGITSVVLVLAFGGLLYSTLSEGMAYYIHVDEVRATPTEWQDKRLQLHGFATEIGRAPDSLDWEFDVSFNGETIKAYYTGIVPDTFLNDSEVVLSGTLLENGTFQVGRDGIMAKCPSKYEAQPDLTLPGV
jgi:cytochrome c-type biogenesis protein CcmE